MEEVQKALFLKKQQERSSKRAAKEAIEAEIAANAPTPEEIEAAKTEQCIQYAQVCEFEQAQGRIVAESLPPSICIAAL